MEKLAGAGRIFFGVSIAVMGVVTTIYRVFPYMLIPPGKAWRPTMPAIPVFFGILLIIAGILIIVRKQVRPTSLGLGIMLLAVFVLYYIPYQFLATNFLRLKEWKNAFKELDLACGAFIVAMCYPGIASKVFALTIICYGVFHFQLAENVANYVPEWIPFRLFWAYAAGAGLLISGAAIFFRIKTDIASLSLGIMILTWFVILHMPRVIMSPAAYLPSEIASACLALAYSGIAFMAGNVDQKSS